MKKRLLSIFLTIAMMASIVAIPASAWSYNYDHPHWYEDAYAFLCLDNDIRVDNLDPGYYVTRGQAIHMISNFYNPKDYLGWEINREQALSWGKANLMTDGLDLNSFMTRAMIITMFYRIDGYNNPWAPNAKEADRFTDIDRESWYSNAVYWGVSRGVINGYSDNTFKPNNYITAAEFAKMLYEFAFALRSDYGEDDYNIPINFRSLLYDEPGGGDFYMEYMNNWKCFSVFHDFYDGLGCD